MNASKISEILDLARTVRRNGEIFNPLFVGPPGVAKSSAVQQWCNRNGLPFIDLRAAYLENCDLIGFPSIEKRDGRALTVHNVPEFWPTDGEGVLLLEEPNRGTVSVMNTFMQLLTDRRVHNYALPPGWIIASCMNPEGDQYDVNTMDPALRNRFAIFEVEYDKDTFLNYAKANNWHKDVIMFVEGGMWQFVKPEAVSNNPGTKYISPRTIHQLNTVVTAGVNPDDELMVYESILGSHYGRSFFSFRRNERPVLYKDLVENEKGALKRLRVFSDPNDYKNSQIVITVKDIVETDEISDELLAKVMMTISADQAVGLIKELQFKRNDETLLPRMCSTYKEVKAYFQSNLNKK